MRKNLKHHKHKLTLGRNTIRQLTAGKLGDIAGGCDTTSSPTDAAADSAGTCTITFSRPCC